MSRLGFVPPLSFSRASSRSSTRARLYCYTFPPLAHTHAALRFTLCFFSFSRCRTFGTSAFAFSTPLYRCCSPSFSRRLLCFVFSLLASRAFLATLSNLHGSVRVFVCAGGELSGWWKRSCDECFHTVSRAQPASVRAARWMMMRRIPYATHFAAIDSVKG